LDVRNLEVVVRFQLIDSRIRIAAIVKFAAEKVQMNRGPK
jgi:hypothetical protein